MYIKEVDVQVIFQLDLITRPQEYISFIKIKVEDWRGEGDPSIVQLCPILAAGLQLPVWKKFNGRPGSYSATDCVFIAHKINMR